MAGCEFSRTEHVDFIPFEMCINLLSGCLLFQVSQTVDSITHRLKIIDNRFLFAGLYRARPKKSHTDCGDLYRSFSDPNTHTLAFGARHTVAGVLSHGLVPLSFLTVL